MATYKELHGQSIKDITSDPTATGELFYNSTTDSFRAVIQSSAWFAQSPTTTQHGDGAGCGPTTACVIWGGYSPDAPPVTNATEEFNGSGWSAGGNYPFSGFGATGAAGTLTAALGMGGRNAPSAGTSSNVTAEYDGTSWTTGNNTPDARYGLAGIGSQTAAVGFGGNNRADAAPSNPDGSGTRNDTFEYDGTNWTTGNNYPISVSTAGSCGSQTAAVTGGGGDRTDGSGVNTSCTYDGTNWTAVSNINTARGAVRQSGNQTSALLFGPGTQTESWDGSSWTTAPSLAGGGYGGSSGHNNNPAGSTSALLAARRDGSNYPRNTEEFATSTTVTTPGAWATGGSLNTARSRAGGMLGSDSTRDAGMAFGGQSGSTIRALNEEYDGTSFTESGDLGTARRWNQGAGSQTAALCAGGVTTATASPVVGNTEEYDGSSWSEVNNMGTGRYNGGSGGTQTAAYVTGGSPAPSYTNATEEYDGTNWTSGGNLPVSKGYFGGGGTLTAGIVMGIGPSGTDSYEYDGSSWASSVTMNRGGGQSTYAGLQTDGIAFGGTPPTTVVEGYNGTSWFTQPSMATGRYALAGSSGTAAAALAVGGYTTTDVATTEEFTGETTAVNVKTVTTS